MPLPPTRTKKTRHQGPHPCLLHGGADQCLFQCRESIIELLLPEMWHDSVAHWPISSFDRKVISISDPLEIHYDSSWFIITLPIHIEQPSVSLENGWCVVSSKKKPKYERYSTARERRALTCPAWPCRSKLSKCYPGTLQTTKVFPSQAQNNPQVENPSSVWSGQTKSKRTNENKDPKCVIQRLIC